MTTTKPGATTKVCPRCAEEIKAEAKVCHYCRAQFEVTHHGYCAHCHAVVTPADGAETCPVCNGPLADLMIESRLIEAPPPESTAPVQAAAAPPPVPAWAPAPPSPPPPTWAPPPTAPAPVSPGHPAPVSQQRAAIIQVGKLRRAIVPTTLQWLAHQVVTLAIFGLGAMVFLSFAFEGLRIDAENSEFLRQSHSLGPIFLVLAFVMGFLMPWRMMPRSVGGSRLKALYGVPFLRKVRHELGARALYRAKGYVAFVSAITGLWVVSLLIFMAGSGTPEGWETKAGTPITWAILVVGLVSSVLNLPFGRVRHVQLDDEGNLFPDEGRAPQG